MVKRLLLILIVIFTMTACAGSKDKVMSERKLASVLYDYHLAQALSADLSVNSAYKQELYYNYVFEKHGITSQDFERALEYYTRHPDKLHDIYGQLSEKVGNDRDALLMNIEKNDKKLVHIQSGDSIDIWPSPRNRILTRSYFLNPVSFDISPDTTFYCSDSLCWSADIHFYGSLTSSQYAYISMSLDYGDSISTADTLVSSSGGFCLVLRSDEKKRASRFFGSVTYMDTAAGGQKKMLLADISLLRTHRHAIISEPDVSEVTKADSLEVSADSADVASDTIAGADIIVQHDTIEVIDL